MELISIVSAFVGGVVVGMYFLKKTLIETHEENTRFRVQLKALQKLKDETFAKANEDGGHKHYHHLHYTLEGEHNPEDF